MIGSKNHSRSIKKATSEPKVMSPSITRLPPTKRTTPMPTVLRNDTPGKYQAIARGGSHVRFVVSLVHPAERARLPGLLGKCLDLAHARDALLQMRQHAADAFPHLAVRLAGRPAERSR